MVLCLFRREASVPVSSALTRSSMIVWLQVEAAVKEAIAAAAAAAVVDSPKLFRRGHDVAEHSCSALALAPAIDFVVVQDSGSAAASVAVGDSGSTAQVAQLVVECTSAVLEAECGVAVRAEQVVQAVRNAQEVV